MKESGIGYGAINKTSENIKAMIKAYHKLANIDKEDVLEFI